MSAATPQAPAQPADPRDWPRDFDVRARYAEQQELLGERLHTPTAERKAR